MSQHYLMQTLKFTDADLKANRAGQISAAQRERYTPPKPTPLVMGVVLAHIAAVGGLLAILAIVTKSAVLWVIFVVVVVTLMTPIGMMQQGGILPRPVLRQDIASGKVAKACGMVILQPQQSLKPYYELTVAGVTMEIEPAIAAQFKENEIYCVYYLPGSRTLLSAEPVEM
jgi:hypothetical protein